MPKKDTRAALRAALAAHVRETYGVPITQYRDCWLTAPDDDERFTFEGLDFIRMYEALDAEDIGQ
jgi:hypothetical protein